MKKTCLIILIVVNGLLYSQDEYNAKFALLVNTGWVKLAGFDLGTLTYNTAQIHASIHYTRTQEAGYSVEADMFLRKNTSTNTGKWNYLITGTEIGELVKFKRIDDRHYELYAKSLANYGHVSFFLTVTKESGFNVTIPSSTTFVTDPDIYDDVPLSGDWAFLGENVGIGTAVPDSELTVKGDIHAEEVKVDLSVPGPDYVFNEDYHLISLEELQKHIREKGHLPNIPSAEEMEENGIELGNMNMKLLEKIEELTLYTINQERLLKQVLNRVWKLESTQIKIE